MMLKEVKLVIGLISILIMLVGYLIKVAVDIEHRMTVVEQTTLQVDDNQRRLMQVIFFNQPTVPTTDTD